MNEYSFNELKEMKTHLKDKIGVVEKKNKLLKIELKKLRSYLKGNKEISNKIKFDKFKEGTVVQFVVYKEKKGFPLIDKATIFIYHIKRKSKSIMLKKGLSKSDRQLTKICKDISKERNNNKKELTKLNNDLTQIELEITDRLSNVISTKEKTETNQPQKKKFKYGELKEKALEQAKKHNLQKGEELKQHVIDIICKDLEEQGYDVKPQSVASKLRDMGFRKKKY